MGLRGNCNYTLRNRARQQVVISLSGVSGGTRSTDYGGN